MVTAWIKNTMSAIMREVLQLKRPSAEANLKGLQEQGLSLSDLTIRDATASDMAALADLHVQVWNETYWMVRRTPSFETRLYQWQQQFMAADGTWFCLLVEDKDGKLVGFARGRNYSHRNLPDYRGELNKLYLLLPYQRLGIGRRLICEVARRFISKGINNMVLFGDAKNPSGRFHEKLGAKKLYAADGEFHGGYGWTDLHQLVTLACDKP